MRCAVRLALGCTLGLHVLLAPAWGFVLGKGFAVGGCAKGRQQHSARCNNVSGVSRDEAAFGTPSQLRMSSSLETSTTSDEYEVRVLGGARLCVRSAGV